MKKLILILMSVPAILMAQNNTYTARLCTETIGDNKYTADEAVLSRFALLERQIFTCEAVGVKVVVNIKKASKASLDFSFIKGDSGAEIKIKDMNYSACLSLLPIMEDWNNSIKSLLKSDTKNPIEIVLTIQAIKQSVIENPIISRNQSDTNVRAWEFYRYRYAEDLMNNLDDYSYMLIAKERGAALLPYESGDKQGQPRKVSDETLGDSERMSRLIDKILPEKTLDQILLNKNCEETLKTLSIDFAEIDKIQEQEKKIAEENSPDNLEINKHLKKAKEYKVKGEYAKAKSEAQKALILNGDNQEAKDLLKNAEDELKKQDEKRKNEEIKTYIKNANEYIEKEEYKKAKEELEAALALDANDITAKELLENVNKKIEEKEKNDQISSHLDKAKNFMNKGKYAEAIKEAEEVLKIDQNNQDATDIKNKANAEIQKQANAEEIKKANGTYVGTIEGITEEAVFMGQTIATKAIIVVKDGSVKSFTVDSVPLASGTKENTFLYNGKMITVTPVVNNGTPKLEILVDEEEVSYSVNKVAE